jgi:osmotically-inducible protein OsmY
VISTPLYAAETDDKIESSFRNAYVFKAYLKDDAIKVVAHDGVVTLTGAVTDEFHKTLAQETAAGLPGVTRVVNQLMSLDVMTAANADAWICRKVIFTLRLHRNVSASKTDVEVKDGIVTLDGEASSLAQKDLTTAYAADIEGVKMVRNEMTVATTLEPAERTTQGEKLDDASITAQIVTALMAHRSTSAIIPRVSTRNGEVTITGIAQNVAQKDLVSKLAADIQGVTSLRNQMTVENIPGIK